MSDRSDVCPSCRRLAPKLVFMNNDGSGRKVCVQCKRAIKKEKPVMWKFKR